MSPEPLLITGDFNIHVNVPGNSDATRFQKLLTSMGLKQHVDKPISGHKLDLIITRCSDSLLSANPIADFLLYDHITVLCNLELGQPPPKVKQVSSRKIKEIDRGVGLLSSELYQNTPDTLDELVNSYNTTLAQALDRHAPLGTKMISSRPLVPWFNDEIKAARQEKRNAERKWRWTGSREDMLAYKAKKDNANALMNEAKRKFYHNFIEDNSNSQRRLFSAAKKLLSQGDKRAMYPPVDDNIKLVNQLGSFFIQKILTISSKLDNMVQGLPSLPDDHTQVSPPPLIKFTSLTEEKVRELIKSTAKKTCNRDPMPTSLMIDCIDVLLPIITKMINLSLKSGLFADDWKCALVLPLLKKPGWAIYKNYISVSNLPYVSKTYLYIQKTFEVSLI